MHRPIPAPEPNPEPNPAPDSIRPSEPTYISPGDWEVLFYALQERLEGCVSFPEATGGALPVRQESVNAIVLQCAQDLLLLRPVRQSGSNGY